MLYFAFFGTITLLIYGIIVHKEEKKKAIRKRIKEVIKEGSTQEPAATNELQTMLLKRIFSPLLREFKKGFKKRMPGEKEARIEVKLMQAGSPFRMTPVDYRLIQLCVMVLLPVLTGVYTLLLSFSWMQMFLSIVCSIAVSLMLPPFYLRMKIKQRNLTALKELPDVLDLLTVSLEAGLGFDAALSKIVSKKKGVLASEFLRCLEEIRLGRTRREALLGLKTRLTIDEMKKLVNSILQAEKLGIGIVDVLRIQSQKVREERKQRAEEAAMKAPIKMLFPLVLFIFPSLFIVLLGPAVIQFLEAFSK